MQELTKALFQLLSSSDGEFEVVQMLGIDLDPDLIETAKANELVPPEPCPSSSRLEFAVADVADGRQLDSVVRDFLLKVKGCDGEAGFDVVFCFSVTMWIHLNHGDEGLRNFFKKVSDTGRLLVLEPQPWKCYRAASRRRRRANLPDFEFLNQIGFQCEKLDDFLEGLCLDNGFIKLQEFGETKWKRPLTLYGTSGAFGNGP